MTARVRRIATGLVVDVDWRCPNHPSVGMVMACPACRRMFEEHAVKIAALPPEPRPC